MAILELDKIIISKPDTGIKCIQCGGDLKETTKVKLSVKIRAWFYTFRLKNHHYECENCKKKYSII
jgi:uncharacterized protein with PIN domain